MRSLTETIASAWQTLLAARLDWAVVALALYVLALLAGGGRWRLIVQALGGRLGWVVASLATLAGVCVNNITPTGRLGGEASRVAITRLKGQLSVTRGALAALADRLTDLALVAAVAVVAMPALSPVLGNRLRALLVAGGIVALLLLLAAGGLRRLARMWLGWWEREGLTVGWPVVAKGLAFSVAVWVADLLRLIAVGRAFDVDLSVPQGAALVVVGVLGGFVPTIGGLGAVEGALVGTLLLFGVPLDTALAMTTLERTISYGFSTIAGGVVVAAFGGRRLWRPDRSPTSRGGTHDGKEDPDAGR